MSRSAHLVVLALALVATALFTASCGGDGSSGLSGIDEISSDACDDAVYEGDGDPQALIVSDLPMQGDSAERSSQQVEAIRLALENNNWKAGSINVAFQACDDTIAETGLWDEALCRENAQAYVDDQDVLGVIGTYNSGCAAIEIPILNRADLAMISPGNTAVCLTEESSSCEEGQPASLYPSGKRNYARVVPNDAYQGAALVQFTQDQGSKTPFVLYAADDPTSTGQAENFQGAAAAAGLSLAGFETWDPKATDYTGVFQKVNDSNADAVILAGLTEQNGGQLIKDKVAALGSNQELPLIAFDGFAQQSTIDAAGAASEGMYASVPGRAPQNLRGAGRQFVNQLRSRVDGDVELYAPYAGEAAEVLLDAIASDGPDRQAVTEAVLHTRRANGILGSYRFTRTGDPSVGPVTIFLADGSFEPDTEITPPADLVSAARGLG